MSYLCSAVLLNGRGDCALYYKVHLKAAIETTITQYVLFGKKVISVYLGDAQLAGG